MIGAILFCLFVAVLALVVILLAITYPRWRN